MRHISFSSLIIAALFIISGIWLLLYNVDIVDANFGLLFGMAVAGVILFYGLWSLIGPLFKRRKPHWFGGIFGTAYGGLILASYLGIGNLDFYWWDIWSLWPLLFVYLGIELLGGSFKVSFKGSSSHGNTSRQKAYTTHERKRENDGSTPPPPTDPIVKKKTSGFRFVNEYSYGEPNWPVEPMNMWSMVGDYKFDFTMAFIPDQETEISLAGLVGDIKIMIPEDVDFMLQGVGNIVDVKVGGKKQDGVGRREIYYKTPDFNDATRRLIFDVNYKIIDLRIDRV